MSEEQTQQPTDTGLAPVSAQSDRQKQLLAQLQKDLEILPTQRIPHQQQRVDWLPIAIPCGLCAITGIVMMVVAQTSIRAAQQPRENEALMARTIAEMGAKMQEQQARPNICILSLGCGQARQPEQAPPEPQYQTPLQEVVARNGSAIDPQAYEEWLTGWRSMSNEELARWEQSPPQECQSIPSACIALQAAINERKTQQ